MSDYSRPFPTIEELRELGITGDEWQMLRSGYLYKQHQEEQEDFAYANETWFDSRTAL